jgi:hypothetical protein
LAAKYALLFAKKKDVFIQQVESMLDYKDIVTLIRQDAQLNDNEFLILLPQLDEFQNSTYFALCAMRGIADALNDLYQMKVMIHPILTGIGAIHYEKIKYDKGKIQPSKYDPALFYLPGFDLQSSYTYFQYFQQKYNYQHLQLPPLEDTNSYLARYISILGGVPLILDWGASALFENFKTDTSFANLENYHRLISLVESQVFRKYDEENLQKAFDVDVTSFPLKLVQLLAQFVLRKEVLLTTKVDGKT